MSQLEAAARIVRIQSELIESILGVPRRAELMCEQGALWDEHFLGRPYEEIANKVEGTE